MYEATLRFDVGRRNAVGLFDRREEEEDGRVERIRVPPRVVPPLPKRSSRASADDPVVDAKVTTVGDLDRPRGDDEVAVFPFVLLSSKRVRTLRSARSPAGTRCLPPNRLLAKRL